LLLPGNPCRVEGVAWSSWSWLLFLPGSILGGYLGGTMRGGGGGDSGDGDSGGGIVVVVVVVV